MPEVCDVMDMVVWKDKKKRAPVVCHVMDTYGCVER